MDHEIKKAMKNKVFDSLFNKKLTGKNIEHELIKS